MTNEKIEKIMARAIKTAYSKQNEEILSKLGSVEKAVQSAKDDIDYNEVKRHGIGRNLYFLLWMGFGSHHECSVDNKRSTAESDRAISF